MGEETDVRREGQKLTPNHSAGGPRSSVLESAQESISLHHPTSVHQFTAHPLKQTFKATTGMWTLRSPCFLHIAAQLDPTGLFLSLSIVPLLYTSPPLPSPPFLLSLFFHPFPFLFPPPPSFPLSTTSCSEGIWNLLGSLNSSHALWDLRQVTRAPCSSVFSAVEQNKKPQIHELSA